MWLFQVFWICEWALSSQAVGRILILYTSMSYRPNLLRCIRNVAGRRGVKISSILGDAENAGLQFAVPECKGGKCRTNLLWKANRPAKNSLTVCFDMYNLERLLFI